MKKLFFILIICCNLSFGVNLDKAYYTCNEIPGNYGVCFTNTTLYTGYISCNGDINGDGFDDIFDFSNSSSSKFTNGFFWLTWGSASIPTWVDLKNQTNNVSGNNFAGWPSNNSRSMITLAHDINNDGKDDIIIGGSHYENYTGSFYIIWADSWEETNHINAAIWSSTNFLKVIGNGDSEDLGKALDFVDITGDSNLELVVSAPHAKGMTGGVINVEWGGQVYFIEFNNNWKTNNSLTLGQPPITNYSTYYGNRESCNPGKTISNIRDINNDGYNDLAFRCAPEINGSAHYAVNIVYGGQVLPDTFSQEFFDGTNGFMIIDQQANIIEPLGDVNGDNIDDIVINMTGASDYVFDDPWYSNIVGQSMSIFFGQTSNFPHYIDVSWCDGTNGANVCAGMVHAEGFSATLDSAGDMNGDGFRDLIVGNAQQDGFVFPPEYVYVIFGRPDWHKTNPMTTNTLDGVFAFYVEGIHNVGWGGSTHMFGRDVAGDGDINGDGFDDVLMGEYGKGRIYVMYGGESEPQPPSIRGPVHVFQGTTNTWQYESETNTLIFGLKPTNAYQFAFTNNVRWPQGDHAPGSLHFTNSISWQLDETITLTYTTSNSVGLGPYNTTLIIQPIPEPVLFINCYLSFFIYYFIKKK